MIKQEILNYEKNFLLLNVLDLIKGCIIVFAITIIKKKIK